MYFQKQDWSIVYEKAYLPDGSLFFPKRLTKEFLIEQRKVLGSYIFYNQYLNEIIPEGEQEFKREWLNYYISLPEKKYTFAFIDPAISLSDKADYTALVIVDVSEDNDWYLKVAKRARLTATQTVNLVFQVNELYRPKIIGIETVAYQKALMHFLDVESRSRNVVLPLKDINRGNDKTKEMRIRGLIPRFEWTRIFIKQGLDHFEDEYLKFPKGMHDDILDSLSSIEEIAYPPPKQKERPREPHPTESAYESKIIKQLIKKSNNDSGL